MAVALTLSPHSRLPSSPDPDTLSYTYSIPGMNPWTPVLDTDVGASRSLYLGLLLRWCVLHSGRSCDITAGAVGPGFLSNHEKGTC